jgi:hypothetical protein
LLLERAEQRDEPLPYKCDSQAGIERRVDLALLGRSSFFGALLVGRKTGHQSYGLFRIPSGVDRPHGRCKADSPASDDSTCQLLEQFFGDRFSSRHPGHRSG